MLQRKVNALLAGQVQSIDDLPSYDVGDRVSADGSRGQFVYVDRPRRVVAVKTSAWSYSDAACDRQCRDLKTALPVDPADVRTAAAELTTAPAPKERRWQSCARPVEPARHHRAPVGLGHHGGPPGSIPAARAGAVYLRWVLRSTPRLTASSAATAPHTSGSKSPRRRSRSKVLLATVVPPRCSATRRTLASTEDQTATDTHVVPWGNSVIAGWGNYVIVNPSRWGNYLIADT